jgi:hypothetical protein
MAAADVARWGATQAAMNGINAMDTNAWTPDPGLR